MAWILSVVRSGLYLASLPGSNFPETRDGPPLELRPEITALAVSVVAKSPMRVSRPVSLGNVHWPVIDS
jgi:hypothetical protein